MSKTQPPPKKQFDRFIETARELECDEDKGRFEEKLGQIARQRPAAAPAKPARKPRPRKR